MMVQGSRVGAKAFCRAAIALSVVALMLALPAQERASPFERASGKVEEPQAAPTAAPSRLDKMEFTGLLAFGGEVTISLYDTETKESIWVPLDGSENGFSVSGFDEEKGTIAVSLDGITRQIAINENEIVAVTRVETVPASSNAPPKPVRVKDEETLKKEEEARMFVSNLLASGMQQREKFRKEREARAAGQRN